MPDDLGGDALAEFAFRLRVDREDEIGMGLDVDKARRHGEAGRIDDARSLPRKAGSDGGNPPVFNSDVTRHADAAAAVDDRTAAHEDVPRHRRPRVFPDCSIPR
jgi:hypothetical protein